MEFQPRYSYYNRRVTNESNHLSTKNTMTFGRLSFFLVALQLFSQYSIVVEATSFVLGNDLSCSSPVSVSVSDFSCENSDSNVCNFGDTLTSSGLLTLKKTLSSTELCASSKVCLNGYSWLCKTSHDQFDICADLNLQGVNGEKCPEAGTYIYEGDAQIPSLTMNMGNGWWALATTTITDCEDSSALSFECSVSLHSVSTGSSRSSSSNLYTTGSALLGVSVLAYLIVRKRRIASIDLRREEMLVDHPNQPQQQDGHFEMMKDSVRV